MAKVPALVLPEGVVASGEAQVFPGMPGRYPPGVPVAIATLGIPDDEAYRLVKELALPLKKAEADLKGDPLARTAGLPSDSTLDSGPNGQPALGEPVEAEQAPEPAPAAGEAK